MSPQEATVANTAQTSTKAHNNSFAAAQPEKINVAQDDQIFFYNGEDATTLPSSKLLKVRELQATNDSLQRQVAQMEKDLKDSSDSLTILAERERCLIMIARNTGEILKIHTENELRLRRIAELESENNRLKVEIMTQRDKFIDTHDMRQRTKHASSFFLTKSKIEKNTNELLDLTQE